MQKARSIAAARPRDAVADAIAALVDSTSLGTWSGTPAELFTALETVTLADDRAALNWPATAAAFTVRVPSLVDPLWHHGLRLSRTPAELIVERLQPARGAA